MAGISYLDGVRKSASFLIIFTSKLLFLKDVLSNCPRGRLEHDDIVIDGSAIWFGVIAYVQIITIFLIDVGLVPKLTAAQRELQ